MGLYDSPDCLSRLRREIGQPTTADFPTDADGYAWLGEAQIEMFTRLAIFAPNAIRQPPRQVTQPVARTAVCGTTSGGTGVISAGLFTQADVDAGITGTGIPAGTFITGVVSTSSIVISQPATATNASVVLTVTPDPSYIFTFGTDSDGNSLYPLGDVMLFRQLSDNPDWALREGVEFQMEGNKIRLTDNVPWSGDLPYFQCLALPLTLSATVPPVLRPVQARELIVNAAALKYAEDSDESAAARFEARLEKSWTRWLWAIQRQYASPYASSATNPNALPSRYRFGMGRPFWRGFR